MIHFLRKDRWSPYLVGSLIGLLLTLIFILGYQIGISSGIAKVSALTANIVIPAHLSQPLTLESCWQTGSISIGR